MRLFDTRPFIYFMFKTEEYNSFFIVDIYIITEETLFNSSKIRGTSKELQFFNTLY